MLRRQRRARGSPPDGCAAAARRTTAACRSGSTISPSSTKRSASSCLERLDEIREVAAERLPGLRHADRPCRRRERRCSESHPTSARTATRRRPGARSTWQRLHRRVACARAEGSQHALQLEAPARGEQRLPEIAELLHARGHVVDAKVLDLDSAARSPPTSPASTRRPAASGAASRATRACGPTRSGCSRRARARAGAARCGTRR